MKEVTIVIGVLGIVFGMASRNYIAAIWAANYTLMALSK
jgi:hypothetical protein